MRLLYCAKQQEDESACKCLATSQANTTSLRRRQKQLTEEFVINLQHGRRPKQKKGKRTALPWPIETESITVFGTSIPDRTGHQMIVQVPTSLNLFPHYLQKTKQAKYAL